MLRERWEELPASAQDPLQVLDPAAAGSATRVQALVSVLHGYGVTVSAFYQRHVAAVQRASKAPDGMEGVVSVQQVGMAPDVMEGMVVVQRAGNAPAGKAHSKPIKPDVMDGIFESYANSIGEQQLERLHALLCDVSTPRGWRDKLRDQAADAMTPAWRKAFEPGMKVVLEEAKYRTVRALLAISLHVCLELPALLRVGHTH